MSSIFVTVVTDIINGGFFCSSLHEVSDEEAYINIIFTYNSPGLGIIVLVAFAPQIVGVVTAAYFRSSATWKPVSTSEEKPYSKKALRIVRTTFQVNEKGLLGGK
jgi:C4-dicarboxylate transporter